MSAGVYSSRVSSKNVPLLTLPTTDYDRMLEMSTRQLVSVLRSAVLSPDRIGRFSPRPPETHEAYTVHHRPGCIDIHLHVGTDLDIRKFRFEASELTLKLLNQILRFIQMTVLRHVGNDSTAA